MNQQQASRERHHPFFRSAARCGRLACEQARALADCFFPPHCCHCHAPLHDVPLRVLCRPCLDELRRMRIRRPWCDVCGRPLSAAVSPQGAVCLRCRFAAPRFDMARALLSYRGPAESIVKTFKYHDQYHLGTDVLRSALEWGWLPTELFPCDAIAAVPLHRRRRRRRGYNQALRLAAVLAKHTGRPLQTALLRRVRDTASQTSLAARERKRNVRGAFSVQGRDVPGQVLLVDDVLTTGATVEECARVLKKAGCRQVHVFTLARAVM